MMLVSKRKFELKKRIETKLWKKYLSEIEKKDKFHSNELQVIRNTYATRINDLIKFQEKEIEAIKLIYENAVAKLNKTQDVEIENLKKAQDREIMILKNQHLIEVKNAKALADIMTARAEGRLEELQRKHDEVNRKDTDLSERLKIADIEITAFKEKRKALFRDAAAMLDIEKHLDSVRK